MLQKLINFFAGISHQESVPTELIGAYVLDTLDGIEFARGPLNSTWGALRSQMGHPDPFDLRYLAIGNEDCWKPYYRGKQHITLIFVLSKLGFYPKKLLA
jgi:alpha-N-arabinofuranosidase